MRVMITGATGFVGGHLAELVLGLGEEAIGLSTSGRWPDSLRFLSDEVPLRALDLKDSGCVFSLAEWIEEAKPDWICHLAAQSNPHASVTDPRSTWDLNLGGALNLLEAVRVVAGRSSLRPKTVLVGSGVCYGDPAPEHQPVSESCPLRPNNPYSSSKAAADILGVQYALGYGLPIVMARPFNHAGPRQEPRYVLSALAKQVAEVEAGRKACVEAGNLEVIRDFSDVRDIVRGYRILAEKGRDGEIYNLGAGQGTKLADALDILRNLANVPVEVRVDASKIRAVDQPKLVSDPSKLRDETGWRPLFKIEQTLADLLNYWRERI